MNASLHLSRPALELFDPHPAVEVVEAEYRRLLGYPRHHVPGERADELAAWARQWYAAHGGPWVYVREAELHVAGDALRLDGIEFHSPKLREHLRQAGARRALLVAMSAGATCEDHAHQLWQEAKPDEYFFLEIFGSAVVEHLMATLNGRLCDLVEREGLMAVRHYSPGYAGWDVAEQNKLFELIAHGLTQSLPGPLEVLSTGMLRPKKSLLAVVGLAPATQANSDAARLVPCASCSFAPCQYRRMPYRYSSTPAVPAPTPPLARRATYTVNPRALRKWALERVHLEPRGDGSLVATFRFDGTTCSNLGRPLAFDYVVTLGTAEEGYTILEADCRPATGDEGHQAMCAYLSDAPALMHAIATEKPLLGRPLDDVLAWTRTSAPSGCHCDASSRAHKWGLALEAIHFALAQSGARISSASP